MTELKILTLLFKAQLFYLFSFSRQTSKKPLIVAKDLWVLLKESD